MEVSLGCEDSAGGNFGVTGLVGMRLIGGEPSDGDFVGTGFNGSIFTGGVFSVCTIVGSGVGTNITDKSSPSTSSSPLLRADTCVVNCTVGTTLGLAVTGLPVPGMVKVGTSAIFGERLSIVINVGFNEEEGKTVGEILLEGEIEG